MILYQHHTIARDRLSDQCDAEAQPLSRWTLNWPRRDEPPPKWPRSAVTTILEPLEDMRSMEIPMEDRGDAIVLTGL